jgi:ribonucleoside-diphosphate reductase alpha chain
MFAMAASVALQYGAPPEVLARKLALMNFEPKGPTANPQIPQAQSLGDYFGRWLASQFCDGDVQAELGIRSADAASPPPGALSLFRGPKSSATGDTCPDCGGTLQRTGACQTCTSCGYNTGCG